MEGLILRPMNGDGATPTLTMTGGPDGRLAALTGGQGAARTEAALSPVAEPGTDAPMGPGWPLGSSPPIGSGSAASGPASGLR
jgi:hypothetical protein